MDRAVILDTNVLVAAGFNPRSDSARILDEIWAGRLRLVWDEATLKETRRIIRQIPPLNWPGYEGLYRQQDRYEGPTEPGRFGYVLDPEDRKFAALSEASGAVLITLDEHLLANRELAAVPIRTPSEFLREQLNE